MTCPPGSCLLRVGGDFNSQLHRFLQGVPGALVHWLHRLNVDARDDQAVGRETKSVSNLTPLVQTKHRRSDDLGRILCQSEIQKVNKHLCISPPTIICVTLIDAHNSIKITLWKSSNATPATAPRTREAMALQASPTKSGTENILEASFSSLLSFTSKCLQGEGEREREPEEEELS